MSVVRRGTAVVAVAGAVLLGPVGAAGAQEQLPPDDPTISEQVADTPTAVLDDVTTTGCGSDSTICESGAAPTSAGGGTNAGGGVAVLPRTGPYDRVLATAALGAGLLVAGAGAVAAGRRRTT